MSSRRFGKSFAIGVAAVVVVGGGAIAAVGPERIHEKIFGEDEHESVSEFAREHHGIDMPRSRPSPRSWRSWKAGRRRLSAPTR